jgi:LPXTG-motif cell wall-anchored protein
MLPRVNPDTGRKRMPDITWQKAEVPMRSGRLGAVLLLGVLVLLGSGGGVAHAEPDQNVSVVLADFSISPNPITVRAGEKVIFTGNNTAQRNHDLHIEGQGVVFEIVPGSDMHIPPGQTAMGEMTFNTPGTYQMWCPVGNHRGMGMDGTFVVLAATAAPAPAAAQPARPPAQVPAQAPQALPRTGEAGSDVMLGTLAAAGMGLLAFGLLRRRRA